MPNVRMKSDEIRFKQNGASCFELNALSSRSRTVWAGTPGYFDGYLEQSRYLIEIDDAYLISNWVWVGLITIDGKEVVFGFFGLKIRDDQEKVLDHFWIEPTYMHRGLGRLLFEKALEVMRELGWGRFLIYADPPAEGFYLKMGATRIGEVPSRIEGGPIFPAMEMKV